MKLQNPWCAQKRHYIIYCHFPLIFYHYNGNHFFFFSHKVISEMQKEGKMACFGWGQECFLNEFLYWKCCAWIAPALEQLSCMYNVAEGINNAHFKWSPDITQDVTPSAGFVQWELERPHQYGSERDLSLRFFFVRAHTGSLFKIPCVSTFVG